MRESNKRALQPFVVAVVSKAAAPLSMMEIAKAIMAEPAAMTAGGLDGITDLEKLRTAIKHAVREFADEGLVTRIGRTRGTTYGPPEDDSPVRTGSKA